MTRCWRPWRQRKNEASCGATTIIIDKVKSRDRNPKIESACLERSITDPILSFRLLGQSSSIRAENSHIFCITANMPDVSRDLVTRSVIINLDYDGDPEKREFCIADPEPTHVSIGLSCSVSSSAWWSVGRLRECRWRRPVHDLVSVGA